ncbi:MAG TPA: SpoIIE family protein phosphatase [Steroidobacteraceae bacterium]|nr:SpoIIE family protein phosphatase [Steroidobacteraceae bacterium]
MTALPVSVADSLHASIHRQRELAYLQIDTELRLVGAGGHLEYYGLEGLEIGASACEQVFFLEGLLPPTQSPSFVRSLEIVADRAADLQFYLDGDHIWVVLLDVTAERDESRRMQQRAYDMTLLREKEALLNRRLESANAALRAAQGELERSRLELESAHSRLQADLAEAAHYVRSLLPAPLSEPFRADWRFVPSAALGGDALGYHWIDSEHFALYLLDVCGHGVGPSLMSVAVLHMLRTRSLRGIDFRNPAQVLSSLNDAYQMQSASDLYFTLWYGVYQPRERTLKYGCAGHPPALLVSADGSAVEHLKLAGVPIGLVDGVKYASATVSVPAQSRLYILSDGTFEVQKPDGAMLAFDELVEFVRCPPRADSDLDDWLQHLVQLRGGSLDDDFSIVRFGF